MTKLAQIKLLHTAVWFFFASCIVAIPVLGAWRNYSWAAVLIGLVLLECAVLAANPGRCPLTDLAAQHTEQRAANFDIYLPLWLARDNKSRRCVCPAALVEVLMPGVDTAPSCWDVE